MIVETVVGIVGIVVTIISTIVTLINIIQSCENINIRKATAPAKSDWLLF